MFFLSTCTSQMQVNTPIPWIRHGYFYCPYVHTITCAARLFVSQIFSTGAHWRYEDFEHGCAVWWCWWSYVSGDLLLRLMEEIRLTS